MKFVQMMMFGFALIVGVAVGYMFNPSVAEPPVPTANPEKPKGAIRDDGGAASAEALRARIAELEAKLAQRESEPPSGSEAAKTPGDRRALRGFEGLSPSEIRDKMKRENPEQYARMNGRLERMRNARRERAQKKSEFLSSIDVSRMAPEARKVHEELLEMVAKNEEFEQKMHDMRETADFSFEDMGQMFKEMRETNERIRELNAKERQNLMVETARDLGYDDGDASAVAGAFQEIVENTDSGWGDNGGGWGRGHGGRGGNRRGGQ